MEQGLDMPGKLGEDPGTTQSFLLVGHKKNPMIQSGTQKAIALLWWGGELLS